MAIVVANRTAQSGTYYTGSPNYVDVSAGTAEAGMVTFAAKATDASWDDGAEIGVVVVKDDDNWQVWRATWDETNEYLEVVEVEDSAGTLSNSDAVTITATLTEAHVQTIINGRETLTADRTYYVRTDGSDSNDGLTNSAGGAFLTIGKASTVITSELDVAGYTVTVSIADGTYTDGVNPKGFTGGGLVHFKGNESTPSSVALTPSGSSYPTSCGFLFDSGSGDYKISGMKITASGSGGTAVLASGKGIKVTVGVMEFGACNVAGIQAYTGATIYGSENIDIAGSMPRFFFVGYLGLLYFSGGTQTLTGTPAFSSAFAEVANVSMLRATGITFSGSATGKRYSVATNSVCFVNGAGSTYFPGNTSGTTATGGQYA